MSKNLQKYFKDLEFVSNVKCDKTRKTLLKYLSKNPKIYLALKEIAFNIIKGNINVNKRTKTKLSKHKKIIYNLCKDKNCDKSRKKLVVQSGGWLWILPVVQSIIDLIK